MPDKKLSDQIADLRKEVVEQANAQSSAGDIQRAQEILAYAKQLVGMEQVFRSKYEAVKK